MQSGKRPNLLTAALISIYGGTPAQDAYDELVRKTQCELCRLGAPLVDGQHVIDKDKTAPCRAAK